MWGVGEYGVVAKSPSSLGMTGIAATNVAGGSTSGDPLVCYFLQNPPKKTLKGAHKTQQRRSLQQGAHKRAETRRKLDENQKQDGATKTSQKKSAQRVLFLIFKKKKKKK
jgi:hypothetical protein